MSTAESTPLSAAAGPPSGLITRENAGIAAAYMKEQAEKMSNAVKSGDLSIRALSLLGGIAMIATGVLSLLGRVVSPHLVSALFTIYIILFGLLVVLLEGKKWLPVPRSLDAHIRKYALFLEFIWGRGCLYFFMGSLQLSLMSLADFVVGGYMCFVGVTYIVIGRKTAKKLSKLRKSLFTEEELREKFIAADVGQSGTIDYEQFKVLMRTFGVVLNNREAESAFLRLDKSGEGRVTFDEFNAWWENAQFDSDQNAQFALSV